MRCRQISGDIPGNRLIRKSKTLLQPALSLGMVTADGYSDLPMQTTQKWSLRTVSATQAGRLLFSTSMLTSFTTSMLRFKGVSPTRRILALTLEQALTGGIQPQAGYAIEPR